MSLTESKNPVIHEDRMESELDLTFSLKGHELIDPTTSEGSVVAVKDVDPICSFTGEPLPKGVELVEVSVSDPFVVADPRGYEIVKSHVEEMELAMRLKEFNPIEERAEAIGPESWNPFTRAWLAQPELSGLAVWRHNVPTANALGYLTNPWVGRNVYDHVLGTGAEDVVSPETAAHIRFVDDAIGIRNRAVAMQAISEEYLGRKYGPGSNVRWLSLASGTAEPSIKAANAVRENEGIDVDLTVVDYDAKALKFVAQNAKEHGFQGSIRTVRANILSDTLKEEVAKRSKSDELLYDVVENMGFEEYLPQDGDELEAKAGKGLPQASEFTRNAWDIVKPGGMLISGNMILDRSQLGFVFGIVDWPIINARSEQSILRVYKEAGILDDPSAKVTMYRVKDHYTGSRVYNIVKVEKADQ